jgi:hypothetical protein
LNNSNEKKGCCTKKCCGITTLVIFIFLALAGLTLGLLVWKGYFALWLG